MSIIDDALTEHTETLLAQAQEVRASIENLLNENSNLAPELQRLEQLKVDTTAALAQVKADRDALEAHATEVAAQAKANEATATNLASQTAELSAAQTKLTADRNEFEGAKLAGGTSDEAKQLYSYAFELAKREQALLEKEVALNKMKDQLKTIQAGLLAKSDTVASAKKSKSAS